MSVLVFLIPLSLIMACLALSGFVWAVRNGQLDDLEAPAAQVLQEERDL